MTFLGLNSEGWAIVAAIGTCLGAVATFTAVAVSLRLATLPDRYKLRAVAGIRGVKEIGNPDHADVLFLSVINQGRRIAKVTAIGWEMRRNRSVLKTFVQLMPSSLPESSPFPAILEDGQQAHWMLPLAQWLHRSATLVADNPELKSAEWYFIASTSTGATVRAKIETPLAEQLKKHINDRLHAMQTRG